MGKRQIKSSCADVTASKVQRLSSKLPAQIKVCCFVHPQKGSDTGKTRTRGEDTEKQRQSLECGCCTATTALCLQFDHMRPVHLLKAAGVGTFGPDRVLPFPPASVKPLLITMHGRKEKGERKRFRCRDNITTTMAILDGDE